MHSQCKNVQILLTNCAIDFSLLIWFRHSEEKDNMLFFCIVIELTQQRTSTKHLTIELATTKVQKSKVSVSWS